MQKLNPYHQPAGPELDALVHTIVMGNSNSVPPLPYSTDADQSEKVKKRIEDAYRTKVDSGRTKIPGKTWFARYERSKGNPTEVVAETYPLAICRLALLRVMNEN